MYEESKKYTMYRDRKEWDDITPLSQDDGPHPVVKIMYCEKFVDIYDYMRGVMKKREMSERALNLTEDAIEMNAANYTVWHYRRLILKAIGSDLRKELLFCQEMIEENPKNYQVWHHRRVIVEWVGDASKEKRITQNIFSQDSKNYHAWEHRQWVIRKYCMFDGELEFTTELLEADARNNSAWNHRFFVLGQTLGFSKDVVQQQTKFALEHIELIPANESPWSFLNGLLKKAEEDVSDIVAEVTLWIWNMVRSSTNDKCKPEEVMEADFSSVPSEEASLLLLDRVEGGWVKTQVLAGLLDITLRMDKSRKATARKICQMLSTQDSIRCRYWDRLRETMQDS